MVFDRSCQMALRFCFSSFPSFSAPKMTWGPVLTVETKIQKSSRVREMAFSLKVSVTGQQCETTVLRNSFPRRTLPNFLIASSPSFSPWFYAKALEDEKNIDSSSLHTVSCGFNTSQLRSQGLIFRPSFLSVCFIVYFHF